MGLDQDDSEEEGDMMDIDPAADWLGPSSP